METSTQKHIKIAKKSVPDFNDDFVEEDIDNDKSHSDHWTFIQRSRGRPPKKTSALVDDIPIITPVLKLM